MIDGFRRFLIQGNLIELAIAFVIGAAFAELMKAFVADLITPIIAALFGEPSFAGLSFTINGSEFLYGDFLNAVLTFLSVAAAVYFFVVVPYERAQAMRGVSPTTRPCPECFSEIPVAARRCAHCTSKVAAEGA